MSNFTGATLKLTARVVITGWLLVALLACLTQVSSAAPKRRRYVPVYASSVKISEPAGRGTLKGDFLEAAASRTLREAASRWKNFLRRHYSPERGVGDGYEAQLISVARIELMRVYYLLGDVKAGDHLLLELDPLQLSPGVSRLDRAWPRPTFQSANENHSTGATRLR